MSRKGKAVKGFFADIGGMLIIQLLSLVLIPFYLQYISLSDYGYWLVISSIIGWIGLADFGIGFAVTRFFIKALSGTDSADRVNKIANTSLFLFFIIAGFFLITGIVLLPFFQNWFHIAPPVFKIFSVAFLVALINSTIMIPFSIFSGILEARQRIALNRNIQTLSLFIQMICSIGFVILFRSIIGLAISALVGTLVSSVILFWYAKKETVFAFSRAHISKKLLKELFTFGGYFQVGRTANIVATSTDNLFIAGYLDAGKIPVYSFTSKLPVLFCTSIASKIAIALFSGLSQVFDQGEKDGFKMYFQKLFAVIMRMAFFGAILIFFINEKFVDVWVGKNNFGGYYLNLTFMYWVFFETMIRGTSIVIQVYGDLKMWALSSVFESIINIGLSFYFLYINWGIIGLAVATAIARTVTIGVYWAWFLNRNDLYSYKNMIYSFFNNLLKNIPLLIMLFLFSRLVSFGGPLPDLIMYTIAGVMINIIFYDSDILFTALRERSMRAVYTGYRNKY